MFIIDKTFQNHLIQSHKFFDLEKANDTTWKYGIMKDLHNLGLKGQLPTSISKFLSDRSFNVRIKNTISDTFKMEQGVPQGSILSPIYSDLRLITFLTVLKILNVPYSLMISEFSVDQRIWKI